MTLEIVNSCTSVEMTSVKVIENFIRKDLEIFNWMNSVSKQFGDFKIYEDYRLELNSFDQGLSLLVGREIQYGEDCIESYSTDKCVEYLFGYSIDENIKTLNTEVLANKFTSYLLEARSICLFGEAIEKKKLLDNLFKIKFPEFQPMLWDYVTKKFSSNNA